MNETYIGRHALQSKCKCSSTVDLFQFNSIRSSKFGICKYNRPQIVTQMKYYYNTTIF